MAEKIQNPVFRAHSAPHLWQSGGSSPTTQVIGVLAILHAFGSIPFHRVLCQIITLCY